jgi:hypothetical protein
MKVSLSTTGDFVREVAVSPIARLEKTYHLEFSSRLAGAKNPLESMKNFALILSGDALTTLRNLLDQALESAQSGTGNEQDLTGSRHLQQADNQGEHCHG